MCNLLRLVRPVAQKRGRIHVICCFANYFCFMNATAYNSKTGYESRRKANGVHLMKASAWNAGKMQHLSNSFDQKWKRQKELQMAFFHLKIKTKECVRAVIESVPPSRISIHIKITALTLSEKIDCQVYLFRSEDCCFVRVFVILPLNKTFEMWSCKRCFVRKTVAQQGVKSRSFPAAMYLWHVKTSHTKK